MKAYKHKKLWWISIETAWDEYYRVNRFNDKFTAIIVPKELIEDSSDREEVVEKDWKENVIDSLHAMWWKFDKESDYADFRNILYQNTPKQKKFTKNDVLTYVNKHTFGADYLVNGIIWFLKEHNLLSPDDE